MDYEREIDALESELYDTELENTNLQAENKRLRAVLKEIEDGEYDCKGRFVGTWSGSQCADIAREALKESEDD